MEKPTLQTLSLISALMTLEILLVAVHIVFINPVYNTVNAAVYELIK